MSERDDELGWGSVAVRMGRSCCADGAAALLHGRGRVAARTGRRCWATFQAGVAEQRARLMPRGWWLGCCEQREESLVIEIEDPNRFILEGSRHIELYFIEEPYRRLRCWTCIICDENDNAITLVLDELGFDGSVGVLKDGAVWEERELQDPFMSYLICMCLSSSVYSPFGYFILD
ncbi:hypothetical protein PanWU01x14_360800 [Parasponia andersonii]|uniref:Uncharacterized protein n=1 Tax=Parasponia andersonii TaxID=3476 RepID=A0A2P5A7I7_PARAD|nr:hypothetical protein PanWU01x14_360800 [Parasponia andersonii]